MGLRPEVRLALAVTVLATASNARADGDLVVTRSGGTTGCPDGDELRRLARASAAPALPSPTHAYRVSFDRTSTSYRVEIVDDTTGRLRRLDDAGPACGPLAQAAAVVVATMWSSEGAAPVIAAPAPMTGSPAPATAPASAPAPSPAPAPAPAPASATAPASASAPAPASALAAAPESGAASDDVLARDLPSRPRRWVAGAGAGVAAAVVRPVAPAFFAAGSLEWSHGSVGVGALWIPTQRISVSPGSIGVQVVSASLRGCAFVGDATKLGACASVLAGQLHASGTGYSADESHGRPWIAAAPEIFVEVDLEHAPDPPRSVFGPVRCRASAEALVPLHAETFSITGASVAYDTPAVGGLFSLSIEVETP